jgi:CRISPR-associated protein Cas2
MIRVVSYDISEDRTRQRVSKILEGYLNRVQYSVFEGELREDRFEELQSQLQKELSELGEEDSIRIYVLCRSCLEQAVVWGAGEIQKDPDHYMA